MTSTSVRLGRVLGGIALVLALLGGLAWGQPGGPGPAGGPKAPDHSAHDRTKLPKAQRAKESVDHAKDLRKQIDELGSGSRPCPRTFEEWQAVLDLVAKWRALQEARPLIKAEFKDQLDNQPLGQELDAVFDGKKKATQAAEAAIMNCNPPADVAADGLDLKQKIQERVPSMIDAVKAQAGLIVLAVTQCPDCKKEQQRVNTGPNPAAARR